MNKGMRKKIIKNKNLDIYKKSQVMNLKRFLYNNKVWQKDQFFTHTSQGDVKGRFLFNREELEILFKNVNKEKNRYLGLAEYPRFRSMFRLDFDFEREGTNLTSLYEMDNYLNNIIPQIQANLKDVIIDFRKEMLDAVILTKKPYIKNNKKIKHGLHIVFPNLFINNEHFSFFEEKYLKDLDGYDPTFTKPWLMYGQSKERGKGWYEADKVLTHDGFILEPKTYFLDYVVYDKKENPVDFGDNVESYYPKIFSIFSYGRPTSEFKIIKEKKRIIKKQRESKPIQLNMEDSDIKKLVCNLIYLLSSGRATERDSWRDVGYCIYNFFEEEGLDLFLDFSQKSEEYDENGCIYFYESICRSEIGFGSLKYWALEDNYYEANKLLKSIEKEEDKEDENREEFKKIEYEKIPVDKTICDHNVGDYSKLLENTDILCIKSNMGTYKTQNLKKLFSQYRRILITTFRRSLASEFLTEFGEYGFMSYEDFEGKKIKGDRIICQIDSIHKIRGEFDLIIHDEIVGTIEHIHSFVKEKKLVWDVFNFYNKDSSRVIVLDALLDNNSINLMKTYGKKVFVLENTFKTLTHKKYKIIRYSKNRDNKIWLDIKDFANKGSVFIPTNSSNFATKLELYLKNEGISVGLDDGDREENIPTSEWKNYRVFITTPTNIAGVSCNDQFDYCCPIFTNNSCNAEMGAQMIRRVRNIKDDTYYIYDIGKNMGGHYPTKKLEIKDMLNKREKLYLNLNFNDDKKSKLYLSGFDIDYKNDKLKETPYFKSFINFIQRINRSKKWFFQALRGVLEIHGLEEIEPEEEREIDSDEAKEVRDNVKKMKKDKKILECERIAKSNDITQEQYDILSNKVYKKREEKDSIIKYELKDTFEKSEITTELVFDLRDKINIYRNLCKMNCDNLEEELIGDIKHSVEYMKDKSDVEKLHYKRTNQKIYEVNNIIKKIGFKETFANKIIFEFPYDKMYDYFVENAEYHSLLFNSNPQKILDLDKESKGYKRVVLNCVNNKLNSVCGLSIGNLNKGRKSTSNPEYYIKGFEIWTKHNIKIKKWGSDKNNNIIINPENNCNFTEMIDILFPDEIIVK
jgi:hypothetical protein